MTFPTPTQSITNNGTDLSPLSNPSTVPYIGVGYDSSDAIISWWDNISNIQWWWCNITEWEQQSNDSVEQWCGGEGIQFEKIMQRRGTERERTACVPKKNPARTPLYFWTLPACDDSSMFVRYWIRRCRWIDNKTPSNCNGDNGGGGGRWWW